MLSPLADADIAALEAEGIRPTAAEVVRLNALALRVGRCPEAAEVAAAPRVAYAGNIILREPSVAAEEWIEVVAVRLAASPDAYWSMVAFACAFGHIPGFFDSPALNEARGVNAELSAWRRSIVATQNQLRAALDYALYGDDPDTGEYPEPPPPKPGAVAHSRIPAPRDWRQEVQDALLAEGVSLSTAEMGALQSSRLRGILIRWVRAKGAGATAEERGEASRRAQVDYVRTLAAVRAAHAAHQENAPRE